MFVLWKDHTAIAEAEEINELAGKWHTDYTKYEGGIYSAEWAWAKVMHLLRQDGRLAAAAYSWAEHCDWMPAMLCGKTRPEIMFRSRCAAGHKAMWHEEWGGLPDKEFLSTLDRRLAGLKGPLFTQTVTADTAVGTLTQEWAGELGLSREVVVGAGALDCHIGAVGAGIEQNNLVRVIGTSTCDIMIAHHDELKGVIPGICGQVDGSVVPGYIGLEAGRLMGLWYQDT
jgi:L-ribulokinase